MVRQRWRGIFYFNDLKHPKIWYNQGVDTQKYFR